MGMNCKKIKRRKVVEESEFVNWTCDFCKSEIPWTQGPGIYLCDPIGAMTIKFGSYGHAGYTSECFHEILICKECVESKSILEVYEVAQIPHWKK
jgi:hypothetical protein